MAVDLTARTCTECANASVCPHKEIFMKFFENRDKLMVKCGDENDGSGGTSVDTSKSVSVRIEHRYLDGPGLERLYRDMGLVGSGSAPCVAPHSGCPMFHHPHDAPIYSPYPHAAGYIAPLCRDARDDRGNHLQYIAPIAAPRTNEVHASPYPTYPGLNWWSCKKCPSYASCNSADNVDYAKLGGTVYSTFGLSYIDANIGSSINLADIPTPKEIMANYKRADSNPTSFLVESEENVFIVYYVYDAPTSGGGSSDEDYSENMKWMTLDEIKEAGLMHDVEMFYNDLTYVYPSDGTTSVPMSVHLEGIICGPINRRTDDGRVVCVMGDYIPLQSVANDVEPLYTSENHAIYSSLNEAIGAVSGKKLTVTEEGIRIKGMNLSGNRVDIGEGNYRKITLAEGDKLIIGFYVDQSYKLDINTMKLMNYGVNVDMEVIDDQVQTSGKRYIRFMVELPKEDIYIQTCLVSANYLADPANFRPIEYLNTWDPTAIALNTPPVTVLNEKVWMQTYRPIAPRRWPAASVPDRTPLYAEDCPPSSQFIVRPFFDIIGYTEEAAKRLTFDPSIRINNAALMTYPKEIRFLATRENSAFTYWAMWVTLHKRLHQAMCDIFESSSIKLTDRTAMPGEFVAKVASTLSKPAAPGTNNAMRMTDPVHLYDAVMDYTPNNAKTMLDWMSSLDLPDNFKARLYALPNSSTDLLLSSNYEHEHMEAIPNGNVTHTLENGVDRVANPISRFEITADNVDEISIGHDQIYLMLLYPESTAGMSVYCQNFMAYQIHVKQNPIVTQATFILNGDHAMFRWDQVTLYDKMKAYQLSNIYPEDANDVQLTITGNVVHLTGDKAEFYKLANTCDIVYQEDITVKSNYVNMPVHEEQHYAVPYHSGSKFDFIAPEGDCIIKITIDDAVLMYIEDGEIKMPKFIHDDGTAAQVTASTTEHGLYTVHLWDIAGDHEISVVLRHGDDGTIEGCSRCKGYVDAAQYEHIEWVPICTYFK